MDNNNNNNNRNNNGIGESLFWKVFSNIYLLKYIINTIHTTEWVIYDDHKEIKKNNRYKFKEIFSLDWMIEYKQYPLLKSKIESGDFIHFNVEDIDFIFNKISTLSKKEEIAVDSTDKKQQEKLSKLKIEKQEQLDSINQILKMFMEKKRIEFEICDLTKLAVNYNCLDALKLFTNEPYSITVYPSTFESAILKCHPSIVQHLLSLNQFNFVTDEIKIKSLKLASQNTLYRNEMVEFILDNPNLYQLPQLGAISNKEYCISFKDFFKLKSFTVKSKLMDMISRDNMIGYTFSTVKDLKITHTFEEMLILLKIHYKYVKTPQDLSKVSNDGFPLPLKQSIDKIIKKYGDKHENKDIKFKELVKILIIEFKSLKLYSEFIIKYKDSIDEYHNDGYRSIYKKKGDLLSIFRYMGINGFNGLNNQEYYKNHLNKCMEKIASQRIEYYPLLDLIETKSDGSKILNINNKSVIDWLVKSNFTLVNSFISRHTSVEFSTVELWKYAFNNKIKITKSKLITDGFTLTNCFNQAIKECDIKTLEELELHFGKYDRDKAKLQLPNDESKIQMLIKHFNKTNYKGFPMPFIYVFFKIALINVPTISLSNVKIDFALNLIVEISTNFLAKIILALDFKMTEIFINNIKHILLNEEQLEEFIFDEREMFDSENCVYFHFDYDANELVSIVGKLMNKFNSREILQNKEDYQNEIQSYQAIFNYYFQTIIQIEFVTLDSVLSIHKLLIDNSFTIDHTLFHSFYYLQLRDPKLIKYILSRPGYKEFFDHEQVDVFSATAIYSLGRDDVYNGFNLSKHLNINQFTFDYILGVIDIDIYNDNKRIFKHSFDNILGKLVTQLSINLASTEKQITKDFFNESLNADLLYFMIIRRIDLFFSHLEYISSKLEESIKPEYKDKIYQFPIRYEIYNSPSTELLPTSTLFQNCNSRPKLYLSKTKVKKDSLSILCTKYSNAFKSSDELIELVVLDMDIQDIQRFIEFNWGVSQLHNKIFKISIWFSRYDISKFILDNYSIEIFSLPLFPGVSSHYNHHGEFKFITENYLHKVSNLEPYVNTSYPLIFINQLIHHLSNSNNQNDYDQFILLPSTQQLVIEKLIIELYDNSKNMVTDKSFTDFDKMKQLELQLQNKEIQSFIKLKLDIFIQSKLSKLEIEKDQLVNEYLDQDDNMFNESFNKGDIIMCNLILNCYPSIFKITKQSIKKVIGNGRIHIIKYFYNQDNCKLLINNFQSDIELFDYLKQQLLIHIDYKYDLNWL